MLINQLVCLIITEGYFTECSGIGPIVNLDARPVDYTAITLKYGVSKSRDLWDWMMKAAEGNVERRNVSILLLDSQADSDVMERWNLQHAWRSKWQGAGLNASENALAIESLTLVYDSLELA